MKSQRGEQYCQYPHVMEHLEDIVARIARKDPARAEATLQGDIRSFILAAGLNVTDGQMTDVNLETQLADGTRRRIDIETGTTVIEVKKDLSRGTTRSDAEAQLSGYLQQRARDTGARYLGILTDGQEWSLYVPDPDGTGLLPTGSPLRIASAADTEELRYWLGTVLATVDNIRPSAEAIVRELGADSPAHDADHATLQALYEAGASRPEVKLKRELWAKLLRTAFGSAFDDDQELFVNHTLLVLTGEIIAHAVLGIDIAPTAGIDARTLVTGSLFSEAQITGVVESDFFDWPADVIGGDQFIHSLTKRLARFDWSHPDHDVLKHLYEAVISPRTREALGEYYTPDWLAEAMVSDAYPQPLEATLADVACGSGTFLFHAARAYLKAADSAGLSNGEAVATLTSHVMGIDIHPVAVTLARVTYLLAIGTERLSSPDRGKLRVPVFLGDSLNWEDRRDLLSGEESIRISTAGDELVPGAGGTLFDDDLVFPNSVTTNAEDFDSLVADMADKALNFKNTQDKTLINPVLNRAKISDPSVRAVLTETFSTWRALNRTGRNHIWGYYVRNLVRPVWLTQPANRVDVLIGNPPWLRYNKMTNDMQKRYIEMSRDRNLLSGAKGASARDLSTLFVTRAIEQYGATGVRFAFVMPLGTLTRGPHEGFRSGKWSIGAPISFDQSWDLTNASKATGFPMTSCVVRGSVTTKSAKKLPSRVEAWTVKGARPSHSWNEVQEKLTRETVTLRAISADDVAANSPYKKKFRQGAIVVPRALFFVEEEAAGPLGAGAGRIKVKSRRSNLEKKPWSLVESLAGTVERSFVHPVHLGETILPFRAHSPLTAVIPISLKDPSSISGMEEVDLHPGLSNWWQEVEERWRANRVSGETKPLLERVDYASQLSAQLPLEHAQRVVYSKAGNTLAAARIDDPTCIIDHKLYWAPVRSGDEGRYLVGILNSATLLERVRPLQTIGLFGPRDFDKHVFDVPFPAFDATNELHSKLASLVQEAEDAACTVDVTASRRFQDARKAVREQLNQSGTTSQIEGIVDQILPVIVV